MVLLFYQLWKLTRSPQLLGCAGAVEPRLHGVIVTRLMTGYTERCVIAPDPKDSCCSTERCVTAWVMSNGVPPLCRR